MVDGGGDYMGKDQRGAMEIGSTSVVEIGVEVLEGQLGVIIDFLRQQGIPLYIEPSRVDPWTSLADLEVACEGK